jgi:hypothetical protein
MDLAPLRTWAAAIKLRKRPTLFSGREAGAAEPRSADGDKPSKWIVA